MEIDSKKEKLTPLENVDPDVLMYEKSEFVDDENFFIGNNYAELEEAIEYVIDKPLKCGFSGCGFCSYRQLSEVEGTIKNKKDSKQGKFFFINSIY